jgi:hypothetical protein
MRLESGLRRVRIALAAAVMTMAPFAIDGSAGWNVARADELPDTGDGGCNNTNTGHCSYYENGQQFFRLGAYCSWYRPDCDTCCPKRDSNCQGQNGFTDDLGQCG